MKLRKIWLMSLVCLVISACNNDDNPGVPPEQPKPEMSFTMTTGVIKNNSAALKVVPSLDDAEYYIHLFTQEEYQACKENLAAKMKELAADGTQYNKGKRTLIYTDLTPKSSYVACASAVDETDNAKVKTAEFTTVDKETTPMEIKGVNIVNDGDWDMNGTTQFHLYIYNATMPEGGWWTDGEVLQVWAMTDWMDDVPQADYFQGLYISGAEEQEEPGLIMNNNTNLTYYGDEYASTNATHAEMAMTLKGEEYVISGIYEFEDGRTYSVYYKGSYTYVQGGYYGYKSYEPQLDKDVTGLQYTLMKEAYYNEKKDGVARYTFTCVHDPDPSSEFGGFNKHCVKMSLLAPLPKYPLMEFPEGTYTIQEGWEPYNAIPGDYIRYNTFEFGGYGSYYYYLDDTSETRDQYDGFLRSGTITVSRDGEDYIFEFDAQTNRGCKVSGTYRGPITISLDDFDNI